ncbi:hypothetical protein [Kiloniella antarctica]|uniref:Uncharacterized protein n=1 Tax=Kiloniella antarctica TaxID=1550907 RepID=A0ABW5BQR5_9PROT
MSKQDGKGCYVALEGLTDEQHLNICRKFADLGADLTKDESKWRSNWRKYNFIGWGSMSSEVLYMSDVQPLGCASTVITYEDLMALNTRTSPEGDHSVGVNELVGRLVSTSVDISVNFDGPEFETEREYGGLMGEAVELIQSQQAEIETLRLAKDMVALTAKISDQHKKELDKDVSKLQARVKVLEGALKCMVDNFDTAFCMVEDGKPGEGHEYIAGAMSMAKQALSSTKELASKASEANEDSANLSTKAKVIAFTYFANARSSLSFDRPWLIHPSVCDALTELVEGGYITKTPRNHYINCPVDYTPTEKIRELPRPHFDWLSENGDFPMTMPEGE